MEEKVSLWRTCPKRFGALIASEVHRVPLDLLIDNFSLGTGVLDV